MRLVTFQPKSGLDTINRDGIYNAKSMYETMDGKIFCLKVDETTMLRLYTLSPSYPQVLIEFEVDDSDVEVLDYVGWVNSQWGEYKDTGSKYKEYIVKSISKKQVTYSRVLTDSDVFDDIQNAFRDAKFPQYEAMSGYHWYGTGEVVDAWCALPALTEIMSPYKVTTEEQLDRAFETVIEYFRGEPMKYILTENGKTVDGVYVRQIKRVSDGAMGGYIEDLRNLSQDGECWIDETSVCYGYSSVSGNAQVTDHSVVKCCAIVCGNALVENSMIDGCAYVGDNAVVRQDSKITGWAKVLDNFHVLKSEITDYATVIGDAHLCESVVKDRAAISVKSGGEYIHWIKLGGNRILRTDGVDANLPLNEVIAESEDDAVITDEYIDEKC